MWGLAVGPDRFDGRSRYKSLSPSGRPTGWLAAGEGPTATILKGHVQLRESFSLRTLSSAPLRSACRMVAAVLYTHTQPPATYLGLRRSVSERVEFLPFTRASVRVCRSSRAGRLVLAVLGQGCNGRDGRGRGFDRLYRRSGRRCRGGGAVSVRCGFRWKRGLSPR